MKRNSFLFGIIIGLVAPLLGTFGYYFIEFYPTYSLADFFRAAAMEKTVLSALSTFAIFMNVVLLTFYLNSRKDETAKGIFTVSCIYAIIALIIKFLL